MARSKFFSLWGQKAEEQESDEDKKAREASEAEEQKKKDEEAAAAADDEEEDEEAAAQSDEDGDDEEDDDEATKAEVAKVSRKAQASICRAERHRVLGIVRAAGPHRLEAGLNLALGTSLSLKDATAALAAAGAKPTGGRLGLAEEMSTRHQPKVGAAAAPAGGASDTDKAAAFILKAGQA
jgi:hypothetical protein